MAQTTWTVAVDKDLDGSFDTAGDDITADVLSLTTQGGMINPKTRMADIGTCYITLDNHTRAYNPTTFPGSGTDWVKPMRPIRIRAEVSGKPIQTVWQGYIRRIVPDTGENSLKRCVFECENAMSVMQRTMLSLPLQENRRADELYRLITSEVWRGIFADGKITLDAQPTDGDRVTVGEKTYTFRDTLASAYDVLIGATSTATAANLAAAINNAEGAGETYGENTFRSEEVAASAALTVVTVTCLYRGDQGNEIGLSSASNLHLADSLTINTGSIESGELSDTYSQNGVYLVLDEVNGTPGFDYVFDFSSVGAGDEIKLYGRYEGNAGHTVNVNAYNWDTTSYDTLGTLAEDTVDAAHTWTLSAAHTSGSGEVRIQFDHVTAGSSLHDLYIDFLRVTDTTTSTVDSITLSGSTLANGQNAPTSINFETGLRTFTIAADRWNEDTTSAMTAFSEVTQSEHGLAWIARDNTIVGKNYQWELKLPAATPRLVIEGEASVITGDMSDAELVNRVITRYIPRREESGVVIARANNTISVPGKVDDTTWERWTRETGLPGAAVTDALPPGILTVRLPFVADDTGRAIGAKGVITPIRGADFSINDAADGSGFDYTTNPHVRITCSVVVTGSGVEITFLNTAYRTLYVTGFQVRGTAIVSYDPQEILREDQDSIDAYGVRTDPYDFPLDAGDYLPIAVANYRLSRYKTPIYRMRSIYFPDGTVSIDAVTPLQVEIGDVLEITETQLVIDTDRYYVSGIETQYAASDEGSNCGVLMHLQPVSDLTYWILEHATFGVLGSTTRLGL